MSLFNWNVVKGKFVGADNYLKIFGDWRSLIMVVIAIGLVILGFWIWRKAFRKLDKGEIIAKIVSLAVIAIGIILFTTSWRLMTQGGPLIKAGLLAKEGAGPLFSKGNEDFLKSLIITLYYALGTVPAEIITGMVIAYILFQGIKGKEIFRMIFFLPYVTPAVTTAVVFQIIFSNRPTNIANTALSWLGMDPLKWRFEPKAVTTLLGMNLEGFLAGPSLALITTIVFGVWTFIGYDTVIFLQAWGRWPRRPI